MKKFLRFLMIIFITLIVIVLVGALFLPKETTYQESVIIKASPEVIFDYINCPKKIVEWSPWEGVTDEKFSGPECGVGAVYEWKDEMVGGKEEILESIDNISSKSTMTFGPQGAALSEIVLEPTVDGTKVTWTFNSEAKYPMGRWFGVIMVKPMIKVYYKKGLQTLDSVITHLTPGNIPVRYDVPALIDVKSKTMVSIKGTVKNEDIGTKMGEHYGIIGKFIGMNNLKMIGYPICIWHDWNDEQTMMECAMFVIDDVEGNDTVSISDSYEGRVAVLDYYGAYDASPDGWAKINMYIEENELEKNGYAWDEYITDPVIETDTAKWLTRLYQPVK